MSYCAAVDAAADAIASKTTRAAWVVVCTPPRCAPDQAEVAALMSRAAIPVVALTTLGGALCGNQPVCRVLPCWHRRANVP